MAPGVTLMAVLSGIISLQLETGVVVPETAQPAVLGTASVDLVEIDVDPRSLEDTGALAEARIADPLFAVQDILVEVEPLLASLAVQTSVAHSHQAPA